MTKPVRVVTRWDRFKRLTVWHPLNTDPDDDYRHGPRFWYPGYDIIAICLGVYAIWLGSPLLNRLFPNWFTDVMGIILILSASCALVGVVFPKLYLVELVGKLFIVLACVLLVAPIASALSNQAQKASLGVMAGYVILGQFVDAILIQCRYTAILVVFLSSNDAGTNCKSS